MKYLIKYVLNITIVYSSYILIMWFYDQNTQIDVLTYSWWGGLIIICLFVAAQIIVSKFRFYDFINFKDVVPFHESKFILTKLNNNLFDNIMENIKISKIKKEETNGNVKINGCTKPTLKTWGIKFSVSILLSDNQKFNLVIKTRPVFSLSILDFGESYHIHNKLVKIAVDK